jgi:hypothetical protein
MRRAAWIVPTSLVLTGWVGLMWAFRPGWGFCADAIEGAESFCAQGTFSLGAIVGTIVLAALLVVFVVLVVPALVALGLVCLIMGYLAEFVIHESIPPPP